MRKKRSKVNCVTCFPVSLNELSQGAQVLKLKAKIY